MTDRELLELSAKAAGIVQTGYVSEGQYHHAALLYNNEDDCSVRWNPLIDDGDAFRLAGMLHINIQHNVSLVDAGPGSVTAFPCGSPGLAAAESSSFDLDERMSSIRRAITRAAAEIGKQK